MIFRNKKLKTIALLFLFVLLSIFLIGQSDITKAILENGPLRVSQDWSTGVNVSQAPHGALKPVLRFAPNSNALLLVYDQQKEQTAQAGSNNTPYSAISVDEGATWSNAPISTTVGAANQVKGLIDHSNNAFGVWIERITTPSTTYKLSYGIKPDVITDPNNEESDWQKGEIDLVLDPTHLLKEPNIAVDSNNTVHVVWVDVDFNNFAKPNTIYYSYRQENNSDFSSSTWSTPIEVPSTGPNASSPAINVDVNDKIHMAWQEENTPGNIDIIYIRGSLSGDGLSINIDSGRDRVQLSSIGVEESVFPVLYSTDERLYVTYSNRRMIEGSFYHDASLASCSLPCDNLDSSDFGQDTGAFVTVNDTYPTYIYSDIGYDATNETGIIFFHGDDGIATQNNELVMGIQGCGAWGVRDTATDANSYRALIPSIAVKNGKVFLAYDQLTTNGSQEDHQIYVQSRQIVCIPPLYLPIISKPS